MRQVQLFAEVILSISVPLKEDFERFERSQFKQYHGYEIMR